MATSDLSSRNASNENVEDDPLEELSRLVEGAKRRLINPAGEQA
jgi:hypothetical protein